MDIAPPRSGPAPTTGTVNPQTAALREAAQELEINFLTEMLKSAGLGKTRDAFGGGIGEDQFSSFLVRAQATEMAKAGGIGLAEVIFESLKERQAGHDI